MDSHTHIQGVIYTMKEIDVSKFEKKIILRNIEEKDFNDIIKLSELCFQNMEPWRYEELKSHISVFPKVSSVWNTTDKSLVPVQV